MGFWEVAALSKYTSFFDPYTSWCRIGKSGRVVWPSETESVEVTEGDDDTQRAEENLLIADLDLDLGFKKLKDASFGTTASIFSTPTTILSSDGRSDLIYLPYHVNFHFYPSFFFSKLCYFILLLFFISFHLLFVAILIGVSGLNLYEVVCYTYRTLVGSCVTRVGLWSTMS